jgi:hypothetical protein
LWMGWSRLDRLAEGPGPQRLGLLLPAEMAVEERLKAKG